MNAAAVGMNVAGQAGTSSMPGFADNTQKADLWGYAMLHKHPSMPRSNTMSMAINRISASGVAAMLYGMPVNKPSRVVKVDSGNRANIVAAGTSSQAVQGVSGSQSDTSSTAEQSHASFTYALAALSSVATTSTMAQPSSRCKRPASSRPQCIRPGRAAGGAGAGYYGVMFVAVKEPPTKLAARCR